MKKFLAVLLVVTLAITGVFALDMSIGAELGFGQFTDIVKIDKVKNELTNNVIPVKVDFMLGMDDLPLAFRFDLGTDIVKISSVKSDGEKLPKEALENYKTVPSFAVNAAAYYKYDVNKKFSVLAGLGFGYDLNDYAKYIGFDYPGVDVDMTRHMVSMYIDTEVRYEVVDHVEIFGGFKFGGNVMDKVAYKVPAIMGSEAKSGSVNTSEIFTMGEKAKHSSILWGLSVGAAYKF